jgi:hypothetical protein
MGSEYNEGFGRVAIERLLRPKSFAIVDASDKPSA